MVVGAVFQDKRYTKGGLGVRNNFHCGVGTLERLLLYRTKDEGIDLLIGD